VIPISRPDIGTRELAQLCEAFSDNWLALGPKVSEFESQIASRYGYDHVVATNSGTAALDLAIRSLDLDGTEILTPPITWISTAAAGMYSGYDIGWVDIKESTLNVDPEALEERITSDTAAVIVVHYGGQPADLDRIREITSEYGAMLIEDACHAFGTDYRGTPIGHIGDVACFSFQESKPLTTGEGGALVTNDEEVAARARRLSKMGVDKTNRFERTSDDGYDWEYDVTHVGYKYFMHDISAAIGLAQLERFDDIQARRAAVADRYADAVEDLAWVEPLARHDDRGHANYNYTVLVPAAHRDDLITFLYGRDIAATVHYEPLYRHSVFEGESAAVPTTERVWPRMVTLPMSSAFTESEVRRVIDGIREYGRRYV